MGILVSALLIGNILDVVTSTESLSIVDQQVVVKKNTKEHFAVKNKYNCRVITKNTYEGVVKHIASNKNSDTLAAVIDINVAKHLDELKDKTIHNHELMQTLLNYPIYKSRMKHHCRELLSISYCYK